MSSAKKKSWLKTISKLPTQLLDFGTVMCIYLIVLFMSYSHEIEGNTV